MFLGFKGEKDLRMFPRFPVHANRVSDSDYRLFQNMYFLSEKAMAPHSSTLAWKIPLMEEPGGLQSMGLQRVRRD